MMVPRIVLNGARFTRMEATTDQHTLIGIIVRRNKIIGVEIYMAHPRIHSWRRKRSGNLCINNIRHRIDDVSGTIGNSFIISFS